MLSSPDQPQPEQKDRRNTSDPASGQTFAGKVQFACLQVVEPQVGSRLLVLDPSTKNYAYVNASDVGPSGAPPS